MDPQHFVRTFLHASPRPLFTLYIHSMRRLESDSFWSFFDPTDVPDLSGLYSNAFDTAYTEYERRGLATSAVRA